MGENKIEKIKEIGIIYQQKDSYSLFVSGKVANTRGTTEAKGNHFFFASNQMLKTRNILYVLQTLIQCGF